MNRVLSALQPYKRPFLKTAALLVYLLIHTQLVRPVRTFLFSKQLSADVVHRVNASSEFSFYNLETRLVYIDYTKDDYHKIWFYRIPFGAFFLTGIAGLILTGAGHRFYLYLIAAHLAIALLSWLVFAADFIHTPELLSIPDFLSRYAAPVISLAIIPLARMAGRQHRIPEPVKSAG